MARIKVFCSHRSTDKPAVEEFARRLREEKGIDAWLDKWEIQSGDDFVEQINLGLKEYDVGLVFLSSESKSGKWIGAEISALIVGMVQEDRPIIPVMIDDDAEVPQLLQSVARRGIDEFEEIVDAILNRTEKPKLGPPPAAADLLRFQIELRGPASGPLHVVATLDGKQMAEAKDVALAGRLQTTYTDFLRAQLYGTRRSPADATRKSLETALVELGRELGRVLFAGGIESKLQELLANLAGKSVEFSYTATDDTLLALPFEAARFSDGVLPATHPAVRMLRRPADLDTEMADARPGPLKILVAVGAPDEGQTSGAVLDQEHELQLILDAVDDATLRENAQVQFLEVGHPSEIRKALTRDSFHVLHLSGHGSPGAIELENEEGAAVQVTAKQLAMAIQASGRTVPLVFLSSCHGGTETQESETVSFAQGLLRNGIPRVVSMQTRVSDYYAARLARVFYEELCSHDAPLVSRALSQARRTLETERQQALQRESGVEQTQPEYATASLFCGGYERPLLDLALEKRPLRTRPVHRVEGPVPQLQMDELIGRRVQLRQTLRVLRDHPKSVSEFGRCNGVVLTGIGGVGKSSLAGRVMARMKQQGWPVAAVAGVWDLGKLAVQLGLATREATAESVRETGLQLVNTQLDDRFRFGLIRSLLQTQRILLVMDNFEDNLQQAVPDEFRDTTVRDLVLSLLQACDRGKLLFTSRYPIPGSGALLHEIPLPPLSAAETRKLFLRLPMLKDQQPAQLATVLRLIGGHPRMLEYLDGLLHSGRARLATVTQRLQQQAQAAGVSLTGEPKQIDQAVRETFLFGAHDIMLGQLLEIADQAGTLEVLQQAAASSLPVDVTGLAHALDGGEPTPERQDEVSRAVRQLVETSLVTPLTDELFWVHRWTAESIKSGMEIENKRACARRAGQYRLWRVANVSHSLDDAVEAAGNYLAAEDFDDAAQTALGVCQALQRFSQLAGAATFAAEVLHTLPQDHTGYAPLADIDARAQMALGFTDRAILRYQQLAEIQEQKVASAPDRAEYQRDLSVSFERLGDLLSALGQGEEARRYYQDALNIRERLTESEPDRADYQRDLSVSYNKMGDLLRALGQGEEARRYYQERMKIAERLAESEPDRADYQRDLIVSLMRLANVVEPQHREGHLLRADGVLETPVGRRIADADALKTAVAAMQEEVSQEHEQGRSAKEHPPHEGLVANVGRHLKRLFGLK